MKIYRCDGCGAVEADPKHSSLWAPRPLPGGWTWRPAMLPDHKRRAQLTKADLKRLGGDVPSINVQLHACSSKCERRIDEKYAEDELAVAQNQWRAADELNA